MIMPSNSQESFQTRGLNADTVLHLQRLVLLNVDSGDAYRAAANLSTAAQLVTFAELTASERRLQAATLQNILWCHGYESMYRTCGDSDSTRRFRNELHVSSEKSPMPIVQGLLDIDDYVYSCYQKVINTIQGRGIRQLLSEQAAQIQRDQTRLQGYQQSLASTAPLEDKQEI